VPGVAAHEVQYLHPDHLGSIGSDAHAHQSITSQTGDWVQDVYYYPYGGIRWSRDGGTTPSPASATRRTYTGQYDIGFWAGAIQHYNARQYDYGLGRFLQPDVLVPAPGNPQSLNRYSYAINDPVNHRDPSGHCISGTIDTAFCILAFVGIALLFSQVPSDSNYLVQKGVIPPGDGLVMATGALMVAPHIIVSAGATACSANPDACAAQAQQVMTAANNTCGGDLCASEAQQACGGDCSDDVARAANAASQVSPQVQNLIEAASKPQARELLRAGLEGLTNAQTQRAIEIVGKGNLQSTYQLTLGANNVAEMVVRVPGGNPGFYADYVYKFGQDGKLLSFIQYAYNAAGEVIHIHDKLNNIILK
jgi:RHS repeat-associated protein